MEMTDEVMLNGENYIVRSFRVCTLLSIIDRVITYVKSDEIGMQHARGTRNSCRSLVGKSYEKGTS
jgi:hypothetical protein